MSKKRGKPSEEVVPFDNSVSFREVLELFHLDKVL